jgi:hypothetical protein
MMTNEMKEDILLFNCAFKVTESFKKSIDETDSKKTAENLAKSMKLATDNALLKTESRVIFLWNLLLLLKNQSIFRPQKKIFDGTPNPQKDLSKSEVLKRESSVQEI